MPNEESQDSRAQGKAMGRDFREAVAQWRLAVRTEVKRVSSLPTAMFDATDPMLEMQLAETTEAMLAQLLMPAAHLTEGAAGTELRIETIAIDELRALPGQIASRPAVHVDLLSQLAGEYLGVLADSCCMQSGTSQQRAAEHICADFDVTPENFAEVLEELQRLSAEASGQSAETPPAGDAQGKVPGPVEQIAEILRQRISAEPARDGGRP